MQRITEKYMTVKESNANKLSENRNSDINLIVNIPNQ